MSAFDVDNSSNYTKPSREYGVLGVNYNQNLVPLIANNPWPSMDIQYLAYPNAPRSYYSLTKDNNNQPYATISSGYPGACSFYNIVSCPTNEVRRAFPADTNFDNGCGSMRKVMPGTGTPGSCPSSPSEGAAAIVKFLNENHFILYADASSKAQVLAVFPQGSSAFIDVKDATNPDVQSELTRRGITSVPALVSSSSGKVYQGIPPSFDTVLQFFAGSATPHKGTGAPGTAGPSPVYAAIVSMTCPYSVALVRDIESSPLKSQFYILDSSDSIGIQNVLGSVQIPGNVPVIYNLVNKKSVIGYNSTRGIASLTQDLQ